ncbi:MAG TPA: hypothetical protein VFQ38_04265 [Longimicrobiales bacterium]|nr:hypothetical protein [Longimicrobiales bacterium]
MTAFRDPVYANAQFSKVIVFGRGMHLEAATEVERQLCRKLAPTPCVPGTSVLPPTRAYSADEVNERLAYSGADGVLIVSLVADAADTRYVGTLTNSSASATGTSSGTANLYGNTAYWRGTSSAYASSSTVSTPVYNYSREARALLAFYERRNGSMVWSGELRTSGKGILSVSDGQFIRSATSKIASDVKAARLLR